MSKTIWVVIQKESCYGVLHSTVVGAYPTKDRAGDVAEKLKKEALELGLTYLLYRVVETKLEVE